MEKLDRFGVSMPSGLLAAFDEQIKTQGYTTRSEALRDMVRDYLIESRLYREEKTEIIGTVTLIYDHHTRDLGEILAHLQHEHHEIILCTTHVHLDHHNCLEVVIVRGLRNDVLAIANKLIATRGVKHGKLVCTTSGEGIN